MAFDSEGNLYVASYLTDSVLRYNPDGSFQDAVVATGAGGLDAPSAVIVSDGNLYVSEVVQDDVLHYDIATGTSLGPFIENRQGEEVLNERPKSIACGPDGNVYVSCFDSNSVIRYDGVTGSFIDEFVASGSGGLDVPSSLAFGPDGALYVGSFQTHSVLRYNGETGAFIDEFIAPGSGGLDVPMGLVFGPDGMLYVANSTPAGSVLRYNGTSGDFVDVFVSFNQLPRDLAFGPDGNLYVANWTYGVTRYDGETGWYMDDFVPKGSGGLGSPARLVFNENGDLYVTDQAYSVLHYDGTTGEFIDAASSANRGPYGLALGPNGTLLVTSGVVSGTYKVLRFGPAGQAAVTVSLSRPSDETITVDYATSDGTATAGEDYTGMSGTLTFTPGVTSRTILIPTSQYAIDSTSESFFVNLINPSPNATVADAEGEATILWRFQPTVLFSDSFENGQWGGKWVEDSQNDWFTSAQRATAGNYAAEVDGSASNATLTIASGVDMTPYGSAELTFDWLIESGLDTGEYLALDLFDGTSWQEMAKLSGNVDAENTWHHEVLTIDGTYLVDNFQLRFRAKMSASDEDANVDNVQLVATSLAAPPSDPPVADAGGLYNADEGGSVLLDGSASSDPDGVIVAWDWDLDNNGSYETSGATALFNAAADGVFTVGLRVTDDAGLTDTDTATVVVANLAPTANAGGPYAGNEGTAVLLDGTASSDPGNDIVSYQWDIGNDGTFDLTGATASFVPADDGPIEVLLKVTDDAGATGTALVTVNVANLPPVAEAGGPYSVVENNSVTLDASGSTDPGNDTLTFAWDLDDDGQFDDATGETALLTGAAPGDYIVRVQVSDGDGGVSTDSALVTVLELNAPPVANIGGPYAGNEGTGIILDASGSNDSDGTIVAYQWDLDNDGQYDDASGVTTTFTPADDGTYTVGLRVTDNRGDTAVDSTDIVVANVAPTADAGGPYAMAEGGSITLDAAASTDSGSDTLSYAWDLDGDGQFDDATGVTTSFSTPDDGPYDVAVQVTDDDGDSSTAAVTVSVTNVAPTADAGGPYATDEGVDVILTAAGSTDPGGDIVSYAWDLDGDGNYETSGVTATFNALTAGTFTVGVLVTDDDGAWGTDSATVTVNSAETVVFSDSFEAGEWNGQWVEDRQNDWFRSTQRATDGSHSAEVDGSASDATLTMATPLDLDSYGTATLTFDWLIESGFDSGEYLALDVYDGTWHELARLRGNVDSEDVWHHETIDLSPYLASNFQIRYRAKVSGSSEDADVDNVRIVAGGTSPASAMAADMALLAWASPNRSSDTADLPLQPNATDLALMMME
jgi:PKD repeat protein